MADGVFLASIDRYKTLEKDDLAFLFSRGKGRFEVLDTVVRMSLQQ